MIIIKLFGGLGNQMFQYAAAGRLAYIHRTKLKLDISHFNSQALRKYSLNCFNIQEDFATPDEINKFKPWEMKLPKKIISNIKRLLLKSHRLVVEEKFYHFDSEILNLPNEVYLNGYWQSEKYFKDIEEIIRKKFTIKYPQTGKNKDLAEQINSCESVSLHVRRGDYISDVNVNQIHGICELDYYYSCIKQITQKIDKPIFFVFSDDPAWTRENFRTDYPMVIIEHNRPKNAYEDLRLMSQCKHNIIANSSFSWWAAWLNSNSGKIIFAPKKWFKSIEKNDCDLFPNDWIRV